MTNQISPKKMTELDRNILTLINSLNNSPNGNPSDEFMEEFRKIVSDSVEQSTIGVSEDDTVYIRVLNFPNEECSQIKT